MNESELRFKIRKEIGETFIEGKTVNSEQYLSRCSTHLNDYLNALSGSLFYCLTFLENNEKLGFVYNEYQEKRIHKFNYFFKKGHGIKQLLDGNYLKSIERNVFYSNSEITLNDIKGPNYIYYRTNSDLANSQYLKEYNFQLINLNDVGQDAIVKEDEFESYIYLNRSKFESLKLSFGNKIAETQIWKKYIFYNNLFFQIKQEINKEIFFFHTLRPDFVYTNLNLLLTYGSSELLPQNQIIFLESILRYIVAPWGLYIRELKESLNRKRAFSLTTHGLKTEYKSTILNLKNSHRKKINQLDLSDSDPIVRSMIKLDNAIEDHYKLTGLSSLLEKIELKLPIAQKGKEEMLFCKEKETINIQAVVDAVNKNKNKKVVISNNFNMSIEYKQLNNLKTNVIQESVYFSKVLLRLLLHTILENVRSHGVASQDLVYLSILFDGQKYTFMNDASEEIYITPDTLTGNLRLFKSLFESKEGGIFNLPLQGSRKFKLILK